MKNLRAATPQAQVRLQKALADAGVGARRECEQMIAAGRVAVNGSLVIALPAFIDPQSDTVMLDGLLVDVKCLPRSDLPKDKHIYVLVNKPKGMTDSLRGEAGRASIGSLLPAALRSIQRLYLVGRLDGDSTGLILVTDNDELSQLLTNPRFGITHEYRITASGLANEEHLRQLRQGMYLITPNQSGEKIARRAQLESVRIVKRFVDRSRGDRTVLGLMLREGQNRDIRRMLARVGLKSKAVTRIAIGPVRAPELKPGKSKLLGKKEIERLRAVCLALPRA